jgi:hypothetical protein
MAKTFFCENNTDYIIDCSIYLFFFEKIYGFNQYHTLAGLGLGLAGFFSCSSFAKYAVYLK